MPKDKELGANLFESVPLSENKQFAVDRIRSQFAEAFATLEAIGPCREISLAVTKLEESCMWAVKAISRKEE